MLTKLIDKLSDLIKIKLDQFKLEAQGQVAAAVAKIIVFLAFLLLISFALLFFGFASAYALNSWWNSPYLGFLAVGGVLTLAIILLGLIARSQSLAKAIEKSIIERTQEEINDETL